MNWNALLIGSIVCVCIGVDKVVNKCLFTTAVRGKKLCVHVSGMRSLPSNQKNSSDGM